MIFLKIQGVKLSYRIDELITHWTATSVKCKFLLLLLSIFTIFYCYITVLLLTAVHTQYTWKFN